MKTKILENIIVGLFAAILTLLVISLFFLSSCAVKPIVTENHKYDSVFITETLRDTVVEIAADSSTIKALIECDSLGQAHLKELISYKSGERLKPPEIRIKSNVLTAIAKIDSMSIYMQLKDRYKEHVKTEVKTKIVEVNVLTWWQKYWIKSGKFCNVAALGILIIFIVKKWIRRR